MVLGGSQALSRSLFSQFIPRGKEAEYFALFVISERGTSWIGALTFGLVFQLTGSYREAIASPGGRSSSSGSCCCCGWTYGAL